MKWVSILWCITLGACAESRHGVGARDAAMSEDGDQPSEPADDAEAKFDHSGPDLVRFNRPAELAELGPPRTFDSGCEQCEEDEFCDRDHCAPIGPGGGYVGGTYGFECQEDPSDPHLRALCGGSRCVDGVCTSCRTAEDCCATFPDCHVGEFACLWWDRIHSHYCFLKTGLGVAIPPEWE